MAGQLLLPFLQVYINSYYQAPMRFFLKIRHAGRQIGVRRISLRKELSDTAELLQSISKALGVQSHQFVLRLVRDANRLRVVSGWKLGDYGLTSGVQLQVDMIQLPEEAPPSPVKRKVKKERSQQFNVVCQAEMEQIKEEEGEEEQRELNSEEQQISSLVFSAYEELLRLIQRGASEEFFKALKADNRALGPCENQFYHIELRKILNELGEKGWAAIHYAVFGGNLEITEFLIEEIGVDINLKTSDEWLPVQLAIRQQNLEILSVLARQPLLNVNLCTSHGLTLIMAVQTRNVQFVKCIIDKQANIAAKDHLGRTALDILSNPHDAVLKAILDLLKREERRQSLSYSGSSNEGIFHALVSSYRGEVISVKLPPRKDKQNYLVINPYEERLEIFENREHFPTHPQEVLPINLVKNFKMLLKADISWYMKSNKSYFVLETSKKKFVFGVGFEQTAERWVAAFAKCSKDVLKYTPNISKFVRNDTVILDRIEESKEPASKTATKPDKKDSFLTFLTSKISLSDESNEEPPGAAKNPEKRKELGQEAAEDSGKSNKNSTDSDTVAKANPLKFEDFKIVKLLGEGSFGQVFLGVDQRNPEKPVEYALKCFQKKRLVIKKQIKYLIAEVNILKQLDHPFIVNLHFTFQTPNYVYLGLDYCAGKDLSHHLMSEVTFPENQARLYAAEILLALEYLHEKNIIYRDLKPENIMIGKDGHVKLVDFGLSKQGDRDNFLAKSFCGSPAYLSPEMLIKKGVGKESDYYCFGAVLYEMLVGEPPFFSEDIHTLYSNINHSKLTFPKGLASDAKSLLTKLLERNPQNRLGAKGTAQIKEHSFFKSINWQELIMKKVKAPTRQNLDLIDEDESSLVNILHQDFDYSSENFRINRFMNFSFSRNSPA